MSRRAEAYAFVWGAATCIRRVLEALGDGMDANAVSHMRNAQESLGWAENVLNRREEQHEQRSVSEG